LQPGLVCGESAFNVVKLHKGDTGMNGFRKFKIADFTTTESNIIVVILLGLTTFFFIIAHYPVSGAWMTVIKGKDAKAVRYEEPETYVSYSMHGPFEKLQ
jgi:hypothetical protein